MKLKAACALFLTLSAFSQIDPVRGVYLATVFYHKDNILVTAEDQIPLVEIQCCSTSITQDFLWLAKVNCYVYVCTDNYKLVDSLYK